MRPYSRLAYVLAASLPVGIAASSAASAEPPSLTSVRALDASDAMVIPGPGAPGPGAEGRGLRGRDAHMLGTHGAFGRLSRGSAGVAAAARADDPCSPTTPTPQLIEMLDTLESLDPMQPLNGQFSSPMWVNHPVSDETLNRWVGQVAPFSSVSDEVLGDNDTRKVRLFVNVAQPPSGLFNGWGTSLIRENSGPTTFERLELSPDASQPVRGGHESWNSNNESAWTSEIVSMSTGLITTHLRWGGACPSSACLDAGLPEGAIDHYYWLQSLGFGTVYVQATFIDSAPVGFNVGEPVPVVIGSWHRLIHEIDADNTVRYYIDFLDGQGEFQIAEHPVWIQPYLDAVRGLGTFETQGATHYVDNVFAIGYERTDLTPPPLACCGGAYTDDIEWLNTGVLSGQSSRWTALPGVAVVDTGATQRIRALNSAVDNTHREQFRTTLPATFAYGSSSFRVCVDAEVGADNHTSRAITLRKTTSSTIGEKNVTARLFIGHVDPDDPHNTAATQRLYLQINPDFEPLDVAGADPLLNTPVVGVDIVDIGPFPNGQEQRICVEVDPLGGVTVLVDGVEYIAGAPMLHPGGAAVARLSFESKQNALGNANALFIDNVELLCNVPPLVSYPELSLVYLDDLSGYIEGLPMGAQAASNTPGDPTRWTSTVNAVLRDLGGPVVEMQNIQRDQPKQSPGPTSVFRTQATTLVPAVEFEPGARGWAVGGRFRMTDDATTRIWSVTGSDGAGGPQRIVTRVAYSAHTGTLWVLVPSPNDDLDAVPPQIFSPIWMNTGRTLQSMGVEFGDWFDLTIHMNLDGRCTFRVNNTLLRDAAGPIINTLPARRLTPDQSWAYNTTLERLSFLSGEESAAPIGSTFYADSITAWALPCTGDATGDGFVGFGDLSIVLGAFGQSGQDLPGNIAPDVNGDGVPDDDAVNFEDLNAVLSGYGAECD